MAGDISPEVVVAIRYLGELAGELRDSISGKMPEDTTEVRGLMYQASALNPWIKILTTSGFEGLEDEEFIGAIVCAFWGHVDILHIQLGISIKKRDLGGIEIYTGKILTILNDLRRAYQESDKVKVG